MSKLEILVAGNPVLRQKAQEVDRVDKKTLRLLDDMAETMYAANGVGLAAPQIGVLKRIVVIDIGEGLIELLNPVITYREGAAVGPEGCLSVPDYEGEVERAEIVHCEFYDRKNRKQFIKADGLLAVAIQHELDHLDGVLFIDKAKVLMPKDFNGEQ